MRYVRLVAMCDEYDTTPGLVLKGTRPYDGMMADRNGLMVAHDLLEHQNGVAAIGTVADELEALGGVWHTRGRWGDLMQSGGSSYSPDANVASDITRMFGEWLGENEPVRRAPGSRPHYYDDDFREIVQIARRDIPREYTDMGRGEPDEDENGWGPDLHAAFETYLEMALHRLRVGFRKAERRFGRNGRFYSNSLFRAVKDACASMKPDYEGQEFILAYGNGQATCREVWEEGE